MGKKAKSGKLNTQERLFAALDVLTGCPTQAYRVQSPTTSNTNCKRLGTLRLERPGVRGFIAELEQIQGANRASVTSMDVSAMDEEVMRGCVEVMRSPTASDTDKRQAAVQYAAIRKALGTKAPAAQEDTTDLGAFLGGLPDDAA